jgi:hypothetical protein
MDPETFAEIVKDEEAFVDRPNTFRYIVHDHLEWGPPDPGKPLPGCRFQRSCRFATETCRRERPVLRRVSDQEGHTAACHHMDRPDVRAAMYSKTAETIA